ncbi:hypothetical protein GCM10029963_17520 [Micromonospora andamanensis]|uniref:hypothetical protein n=1 Tax=Micromonospora andamanensis TaxID=1287068 RepID=UPI0019527639|nr:hypothetical protein [Micromonospora andamanensis]GIJ41047.1 hypothetical protein Vwe01_43720 [Micromonospora andamanensis]
MRIAGAVSLDSVMDELWAKRKVFHSEADFQHAFAWAVHRIDSAVSVRLEVRQEKAEYLDLLCCGPNGRTAIEFKYFTARWVGTDPGTDEEFRLRGHAATDLARRNFVFDIARLERFCRSGDTTTNGLAILLTNDRTLWNAPPPTRTTRDQEFRVHDGRRLTGTLRWGRDGCHHLPNQRDLTGDYVLRWRDYTDLPGSNGRFRWLGVPVNDLDAPAVLAPDATG